MQPEWYIASSNTTLIPNAKFDIEQAIGNKAKDIQNPKPTEENITASSHCKGGLLTFSFHVKAGIY